MQEIIALSFVGVTAAIVFAVIVHIKRLKRMMRRHVLRYERIQRYFKEGD